MELFWKKVNKNTDSGCWEWTAGLTADGYGRLNRKGKKYLAHRYAWASERPLSATDCVLHKCDNRKCVNLDHLFLGDRKDNHHDMVSKNRWHRPRGEENHNAKLNAQDVKAIRASNERQVDLARRYGVSEEVISRIVRRKSWTHLP